MPDALSYLVLGTGAAPEPCVRHAASAPRAAALYRARVALSGAATTTYFSLFDGGADAMLDGFDDAMAEIVRRLDRSGLDIGFADELRFGQPSGLQLHHAVVCRTSAVHQIDFRNGCFHFETIVYGVLQRRGREHVARPVYDWRPSPGGASRWADTQRAIVNSRLWLQGRGGVHFPSDLT